MILYKYVPFKTGEAILTNRRVRFTDARTFNDPFDTPTYPPVEGLDVPESFFSNIGIQAKEALWASNTGVLSLTRTPTNPLMWAHYADQHHGMVIGFDVRNAGFTDVNTNMVPAQYGSVVYVSKRPTHGFVSTFEGGLEVGHTHHFVPAHYEKLQRVFLMKALYWAYEEEVRVLKCISVADPGYHDTASGQFEVTDDGKLRLYQLPEKAISEVYFGVRSGMYEAAGVQEKAGQASGIRFYQCALNKDALNVGIQPFEPELP